MTDWKKIQDTPSAEMHKRWAEEEAEQNAFEEVAYPPCVEHLDHLVPERFERQWDAMAAEVDPYYLEPTHERAS